MVLKRLTLCTGSQNNVSVQVPLVLQYSMDYSTSDYLLANPLALKSHSKNTHSQRTNQKVPFCPLLWLQGCLNFNIPPPDSHFSVWRFQFEPTNLVKSSFKIKIWFPPSTTRGTCTRLWEPLFSSIPVYTFQVYLFLSWYHFFFLENRPRCLDALNHIYIIMIPRRSLTVRTEFFVTYPSAVVLQTKETILRWNSFSLISCDKTTCSTSHCHISQGSSFQTVLAEEEK